MGLGSGCCGCDLDGAEHGAPPEHLELEWLFLGFGDAEREAEEHFDVARRDLGEGVDELLDVVLTDVTASPLPALACSDLAGAVEELGHLPVGFEHGVDFGFGDAA